MDTSTVPLYDPSTMEPLGPGSLPSTTQEGILEAVSKARAAQVAWGKSSFATRNRVLKRMQQFIVEHQTEICELSMLDSGKTMMDAHYGELFPVLEKIRFLAEHGEATLATESRPVGSLLQKVAQVEYSPLGVCGIIAPFNWPFHNIMCPLLPVLYAGNGAVIKVSEWTSYSTEYYAAMVRDALEAEGFSGDLVQFVLGWGDVGAGLVTSGVDKIFFTGSPQNGRKVMAAASETLTPVVLELGGKDPMIVTDDADFEHAVSQAMLGVFTSCGQMCVGAERIFVHASIHDKFVNAVVDKLKRSSQGPPIEGCHDIGSTTMPRQLDIIEDLVNDALARGATAVVGGKRNTKYKGQFWEPTVLINVTPDMRIMQEEHFGPVMVIMAWQTDDEVIALANDCPYGLGASVFSSDPKRARKLADAIVSGMVAINDYGITYVCQSLPFGGTKISGVGRINGPEGLKACAHVKAVLEDRFPFSIKLPAVWQYPVNQNDGVAFAQNVIRMMYGDGAFDKAKAAISMVPMLSKL
ncbi:aldehyde dehydrogenase [Thecamonas trahens ATCC 50062]|uniref:Aldehyde dehydrogenase n=1 Tax=Thecamonas trahens ATCC 50062 TaxID=461836 RepID=A0A0L0D6D2_THETB|nr:aldehyde dehydrogenase [Thecamonas trahens ATCC 50062]KNC46873.1 aldehyde dehydrogenase [Thecamonas trahens ATCC 50062]|eukprot:XP_013760146.1 aldehyde dehydrogenase [Thecamonas trahens ATCC 50062]